MTAGKEQGAGGGAGEGAGAPRKKGPWTEAEDAILVDYVKNHGEGNWNSVQRNSGLQRCGKSCRLRWVNHLRPGLKKGPFSLEEERRIFSLHAEHGNKWARIAAHFPQRTDNDIKNYWNTMNKRQRKVCSPLEIQQQMASPAMSNFAPAPATPELMEGNPYFSKTVAVAQSSLSLFNSSAQIHSSNPFVSLPQNPSQERNISFQSDLYSFSPPASSLCHNSPSFLQYAPGSFEPNPSPPTYSVKMELHSSQKFPISSQGNCGLSDPMLLDPPGIEELLMDDLHLLSVPLISYSSPAPLASSWPTDRICTLDGWDSSIGFKVKKEMVEKVNQDLLTLPSMIPVQTIPPAVAQADFHLGWHDTGDLCGEFSNNRSSSAVTDDDTGVDMLDWCLGCCSWNNMPDLLRDSHQ